MPRSTLTTRDERTYIWRSFDELARIDRGANGTTLRRFLLRGRSGWCDMSTKKCDPDYTRLLVETATGDKA